MLKANCAVVFLASLVALSGCATNPFHKETPNDAKISAAVRSEFTKHPELGGQIYVSTQDHVVHLSGLVSNGLDNDRAQTVARTVPGVADVVSTVSVDK